MATQAKVIIKGQNDIGSAVKSASKDLSSLKDSAAKLGNALKTTFSVTAILATVKKLGDGVAACFSDFSTAERSYRQLALAIGDTESFSRLVTCIDNLSRQTLSSKDDIESMVAELAALGKSTDEIEKITSASVYLSNVTGKDLHSSMTMLLNTYNGSTKELQKLGIHVGDLTKKELKHGEAVDRVIATLGDYSQAMAQEDTSQHLVNIKNTWGDIKQTVGGILDYNFGPWIAKLDSAFSNIKTEVTNIINHVGAVMANFPEIARLALSTIWDLVKKTFEWESIKTLFVTAITNIGIVASSMLKAVFLSIPQMLGAVVEGVVSWIAYIGLNIKNTILQALQDAVNAAGEKLQGTWFGKLFGIGGKLASLDLHVDHAGADTLKKNADRSFESIGPMLKNAITSAVSTAGTIIDNTMTSLDSIYGPIVEGFRDTVTELISPTLTEIARASDAADQSAILATGGVNGTGSGTHTANGKILDWTEMLDSFTSSVDTVFSRTSADTSLLDTLGGSFGSLLGAISPLTDILLSSNPLLAALVPIIKGFSEVLAPALTTVIQPVMDALQWIGSSLASVFLPLLDALYPILAIIGSILTSAVAPVLQLLSPVIELVALVFTALTPIIALVGKAFTVLMAPVQYIGDLFSWLGRWLSYLGECVGVCAWNLTHWFNQRSYPSSPGGFSSDAFSGLGDRLAAWDSFALSNTAASDSVSTGTAVGSASYQGATQVTIHIYQQAPIVGDGGMRAFARMIRNEFDELDYYGVTS